MLDPSRRPTGRWASALAPLAAVFALTFALAPALGHAVPLAADATAETTTNLPADPQPVDSLTDHFGTVESFTELTFGSGAVPAIPADFFFPGSQPFSGTVALSGFILEPGTIADTAVERSATPKASSGVYPSFSQPVSVKLSGLALSSTGTISVAGIGGTSEDWLVGVFLSEAAQPEGSLVARFDSAQGGAFSADLHVVASLLFVNLEDVIANGNDELPAAAIDVRSLELGDSGEAIELLLSETPFTTVSAEGEPVGFCPGVLAGGEESVIVSTSEPFEPVRHVFEKPQPVQKHCVYRHQSSTPSRVPPCQPNCPPGHAPAKTNDKCNTTADCPPFKVGNAKCAAGGSCAEVHVVHACS